MNEKLITALIEICWLAGDHEDINEHGGPNLAMQIKTLARNALAKAGIECGDTLAVWPTEKEDEA